MTTMEEPRLFGALRGDVTAVHVERWVHENELSGITVMIHTVMRSRPMCLWVKGNVDNDWGAVMGTIIPLMMRGVNMTGELAARHLWRLHDRWGAEGYEVTVRNTGKQH